MLSPSALDSIMFDDAHDQTKVDLDSLYIYPQQGTVQIIQLIEVSPPTPNKLSSSPYPASFVTSSQSSEYSSESEYSEHSSDPDVCSSFCSSEDPQEHLDSLRCDDEGAPRPDETYDIRATRVHSWRKQFADDMICGTHINLHTLLSLIDPLCIEALPAKATKRKSIDLTEVDDDAVSAHSFSHVFYTAWLNYRSSTRYYYPTSDHVRISSNLKNLILALHPCTYALRAIHHFYPRMIFDTTAKLHKLVKLAVLRSSTALNDPCQSFLSFYLFFGFLRLRVSQVTRSLHTDSIPFALHFYTPPHIFVLTLRYNSVGLYDYTFV